MAKSAYIHIPFCRHKCYFCDFVAVAGLDGLTAEYCSTVALEIEERELKEPNGQKLDTVFLGGGTPGWVAPEYIALVLSALARAPGLETAAEITLETTPLSVTSRKCASWLELGVNRISIGVESLSDLELEAIGRGHTAGQAVEGVRRARLCGFNNIALDLMYGLPEQTLSSWEKTLDDLLELAPEHLSAYSLTIPRNSPLLSRYPRECGKYPDEEVFQDMYYLLVEKCARAGLVQYEIANFARSGYECRHNLTYWHNLEYLAFGAGAHRYFRGRRSSNFRSLKKYLREYGSVETVEEIDSKTQVQEEIFLGLRLRKGIDLSEFKRKHGFDLAASRADKIEELCRDGFLELSQGCLLLTQKGVLVSNTILSELI